MTSDQLWTHYFARSFIFILRASACADYEGTLLLSLSTCIVPVFLVFLWNPLGNRCSLYCSAFRLLLWYSDKHPHSLTPPCVLAPTRISLYSFLPELSMHKLLQICWQQGVQPIKASPLKCMPKTHLVALVASRHSIRHTDRSSAEINILVCATSPRGF